MAGKRAFNFQFVVGVALVWGPLILTLGSRLPSVSRMLAYNAEQDDVNGAPTPAKWQDTPVHWQINPSVGSNVQTAGGVSVTTALQNAFNPREHFSPTTPPLSGHFDVQPTATHEIGHLLGLDHSGIANAIMYPFGDTTSTGQSRPLAIDDTVGVAFLYPGSNFASATG